ncbi:MAG: alpha/beta hydrolase [Candidatus Binatia bacterium]
MMRNIGHTTVESIAAESPKFTAPMVLVHGLWCTAAVWRKFMGYFAHRGWSCHALNFRGHAADSGERDTIAQLQLGDYLDDLRQVIAACEAPPVLVGHDVGGLLALVGGASAARAVVALAPLVPGALASRPNRVLARWTVRLPRLRSRVLQPPRGKLRLEYFGAAVPGGTTPDSGLVAQQLVSAEFELSASRVPSLVLAGERDRFSLPEDVERLARRVGARFQSVEGGSHALPWEPGWQRRVSAIHRWLIQALGDPLLALRAEEEPDAP